MKLCRHLTMLAMLLGAFFGVLGVVGAHDFWMNPKTFMPKLGEAVEVRLEVGDHFTSEGDRPFHKADALRFERLDARQGQDKNADENLLSRKGLMEGVRPWAQVRFPTAGPHWLILERAPRLLILKADRFDAYLQEEGLESVRTLRRKLGEEAKPGRERYWRSLKTLVWVQEAKGQEAKGQNKQGKWTPRLSGQRLEIVPLVDPVGLKVGDKLSVRVLFQNRPLANVQLTAYQKLKGKTHTQMVQTSAQGEAAFGVVASGPALIRLVYMRRAEADKEADWHSDWSAFSFLIP